MVINSQVFKHDLGWIGISFSNIGLTKIVIPTETSDECVTQLQSKISSYNLIDDNVKMFLTQFDNYINGIRTSFTGVSLDISVKFPSFYRKALMRCCKIPYGETTSYKRLAEQMGNPMFARAVGSAMANNPLPIIIPCHRVVRSDGGLGGYGGSNSKIPIKKLFLDIESKNILAGL